MDFDLKPFGLNIRAERARNRLTQAQLAKRAGIGKDAVYQYERGARAPDVRVLYRLAIALGVTPDELMGFSP